jgi:hypothetical protein
MLECSNFIFEPSPKFATRVEFKNLEFKIKRKTNQEKKEMNKTPNWASTPHFGPLPNSSHAAQPYSHLTTLTCGPRGQIFTRARVSPRLHAGPFCQPNPTAGVSFNRKIRCCRGWNPVDPCMARPGDPTGITASAPAGRVRSRYKPSPLGLVTSPYPNYRPPPLTDVLP